MQTLQEITTKNLHDATGKIVRAARAGQRFSVSIDGAAGVLIVPSAAVEDAPWNEIMSAVRAAREKKGVTRRNPVLAERNKRNYAAHLR